MDEFIFIDRDEGGLIATDVFIPFNGLPLTLLPLQFRFGVEFGFGETYAVNSGTSRTFPDGLDEINPKNIYINMSFRRKIDISLNLEMNAKNDQQSKIYRSELSWSCTVFTLFHCNVLAL